MWPADERIEPGKWKSVVLAVLMHVLLVAALFVGVRWQNRPPEAVEVEVWRAPSPPAPAPPAPAEPVREPPPRVEPEPPPKPDIAVKEEKPKKKEPPPKPPEPKKPEPAPPPRRPAFDEALQRELEQLNRDRVRQEALQEKQQRAELERQRLAKLDADRLAAARSKGVDEYVSRIRGKIRGNIVLPPSIAGNPEAVFEVVQLPSGEVFSVKLRKSSGNGSLDAAIERAILKSSPLPKPPQPELYQRVLELKFKPVED